MFPENDTFVAKEEKHWLFLALLVNVATAQQIPEPPAEGLRDWMWKQSHTHSALPCAALPCAALAASTEWTTCWGNAEELTETSLKRWTGSYSMSLVMKKSLATARRVISGMEKMSMNCFTFGPCEQEEVIIYFRDARYYRPMLAVKFNIGYSVKIE